MTDLNGRDRLIVALDVPTHDEAFRLVDTLDNVSFFKVGWELFLAGDVLGFIQKLQERRAGRGGVFVDLKLSGDIGNTITRLVEGCVALNVKFITLVETVPLAITLATLQTARRARGEARDPRLLMVPLLSSLDADDLRAVSIDMDVNSYIVSRAGHMLSHGCDGLIVSGDAIRVCRDTFGPGVDIVSPGIRPTWASFLSGDHKRYTTPAEAIRLGADYLVVGRPITLHPDPRIAASHVIEEIDEALSERDAQDDAAPPERRNGAARELR